MSDHDPGQRASPEPPAAEGRSGPPRPLYVAGLVGALWSVGIGLAVLTTITLIGWIAAPRTGLGPGLPGVFRTAVNFWLVSNHAGFSGSHGRVGLLPLGVLVLPGALLYRSGAWMIRAAATPGRARSGVLSVATALAVPYALLAGLLALAAESAALRPSAWQAVLACFLVAFAAGGLGAARAVVAGAARGQRVRSGLGALLRMLPERPRSLVIGVASATAVLLGSGAVLAGASLAMHMGEATRLYETLAPGIVGGALLLLVELAFLPNAVIWGMAYAVGPGFSVGSGTSVSPTGVFLDVLPAFPPLAALPEPGPAPAVSLLALAAPFLAGAVGGVFTIRAMPSPVYEGAPLWGFLTGALTGTVAALLAALSGGPMGGGRMATVGPSPWQVGLMAALEVGISAAIAAWVANWMILRRPVVPGERARRPKRVRAVNRTGNRAAEPGHAPGGSRTGGKERVPSKAPAVAGAVPAGAGPAGAAADVPSRSAAPKPSPYAIDPLEFEEAEPVLAPRRPARSKAPAGEPLPDLAGEPTPSPAPPPAPPVRQGSSKEVIVGEIEPEPPAPEPPAAREPAPASDVPPPREDPGRTENRGGAIYVLREEPRD